MIVDTWTYLRGYVTVEITGFTLERFLNMAAHRGIYIWNVSPSPRGMHLQCSVAGFRKLAPVAKKTRTRLTVVGRSGLPFLAYRYRRRKILAGGTLFFVLCLYALSAFVWRVDVEGNQYVATYDILAFSRQAGHAPGAFKRNLDNQELARQLQAYFPALNWVDVHTRGTRTVIRVAEVLPAVARVPRDTPANIVAAQDGLVVDIVTSAGVPQVRQHDVVRQGDVLVSGAVPLYDEQTGQVASVAYVHAYAEVWVKNYHPVRFQVPFSYTERQFTGRKVRHRTVQSLVGGPRNFRLPRWNVPFTSYEKTMSYTQPGANGNFPLPLVVITETYHEFIPQPRQRSVEEAQDVAGRVITERIIREFDIHTNIIDKQVTFEEGPETLQVTALITVHQRIDQVVPIVPEVNSSG